METNVEKGCFESYPVGEMCALACKHYYCTDCYKSFLTVKINEGAGMDILTCPALKCKYMVDQVTLSSLIDTETYR